MSNLIFVHTRVLGTQGRASLDNVQTFVSFFNSLLKRFISNSQNFSKNVQQKGWKRTDQDSQSYDLANSVHPIYFKPNIFLGFKILVGPDFSLSQNFRTRDGLIWFILTMNFYICSKSLYKTRVLSPQFFRRELLRLNHRGEGGKTHFSCFLAAGWDTPDTPDWTIRHQEEKTNKIYLNKGLCFVAEEIKTRLGALAVRAKSRLRDTITQIWEHHVCVILCYTMYHVSVILSQRRDTS